MGMFAKMKTDNLEETEDRVGGGGSSVASSIHDMKIGMVYITESAKGAKAFNLVGTINGQEYKETVYFTNRNGDISYPDKQDPKKLHPLPGFTLLNDICLLATGEALDEQDAHVEDKVVKIYDFTAGKDVNTTVPVITSLTGQEIKLAIKRIVEFKQKKDDSGEYQDTNETRTINEIKQALHSETGRTVNEYLHEIDPGEFMPAWMKTHDGKDLDKTKGKSGGAGNSGSGRPGADAGTGEPKKKLFGKK
jgi:hypothetical protein